MHALARSVGTQARPALDIEYKTTFAVFALLTGGLSLLLAVVFFIYNPIFPPNLAPGRALATYRGNEGLAYLMSVAYVVWSVFSIPFVVGLGTLLQAKSRTLALAATILTSAGLLLIGFAAYIQVGALAAAAATNNAIPSAAESTYQAAFWFNFAHSLVGVPQAAFGLGMLLFGSLAWRSHVLPDWLAIVGFIGGVAALVSPALPGPLAWAWIYIPAFLIWGMTTGYLLLQSRGR
jgi:hypothetical protein